MPKEKLPKYLLDNTGCSTSREFKSMKRQELKNVMKAMDELERGAFFLPEFQKFDDARKALKDLKEAMSVKNWGR